MMNKSNEEGEIWRDYNKARDEKRKRNKKYSTQLLDKNKICYVSHKDGDHLIIRMNLKIIDFWPATGLFIDRETKKKQRGVKNLLKYLK